MKEFKIRCSAIADIMVGNMGLTDIQEEKLATLSVKETLTKLQGEELANLQHKKLFPELPKGVQTYCMTWITEQLYGRRKEFDSKYTRKGNEVEADSIKFIAKMLGYTDFAIETGEFIKNEDYFENEFMTGTPDVLPILSQLIVDAKNSWICFTFPLFDVELPEQRYWWQGQGYMSLTSRSEYKVAYTLMNTPDLIIDSEMRRYGYANNIEYEDLDFQDFYDRMTYDNIPDELKFREFNFLRDDKAIADIEARVIACRKFINSVLKNLSPALKKLHNIEV